MGKIKITHIINPFSGSKEHLALQNLTFQSIEKAKNYVKNVEVEIAAVYFKEDESVVPPFIGSRTVVDKSVLDYNKTLQNRKLPTINDILVEASKNSSSDYLIYSNMDIGLHENFYEMVNQFIAKGNDAFAINRRRVSEKYNDSSDLSAIYAEVGEMHTGYDCFVFKRELLAQFKLGNTCIGIPFIDSVILFNLIAFANNFKLYTNKHLTFHVGFDLIKNWGGKDFVKHNKSEYLKTLKLLNGHLKLKNLPGSGLSFVKRHFKWLMNPTIHYPTVFKLDMKGGERYAQTKKPVYGYLEKLQQWIKLDE